MVSINQHLIDIIDRHEGGSRTTVYIPANAGPSTGATVGRGYDLGAHTEADLAAAGLSPATIDMLRRFLGKQGEAARDEVNNNRPVQISEAEADMLNRHALQNIASQVESNYDAAVGQGAFAALPELVQSAIIDLAYQYGPNLASRAPKTWGHMTSRDWPAAIRELRNFGDAFGPRRNEEADLIEIATAMPALNLSHVDDLQRALTFAGYDAGRADNTLGPQTRTAIERFQTANQLTVSGAADIDTRTALQGALTRMGYTGTVDVGS